MDIEYHGRCRVHMLLHGEYFYNEQIIEGHHWDIKMPQYRHQNTHTKSDCQEKCLQHISSSLKEK